MPRLGVGSFEDVFLLPGQISCPQSSNMWAHIFPGVPNMTLALDEATSREVKAHPEIKWSEVARQAIQRKVRELHALDAAFANSELTSDDIQRLADQANQNLLKRLKSNARTP